MAREDAFEEVATVPVTLLVLDWDWLRLVKPLESVVEMLEAAFEDAEDAFLVEVILLDIARDDVRALEDCAGPELGKSIPEGPADADELRLEIILVSELDVADDFEGVGARVLVTGPPAAEVLLVMEAEDEVAGTLDGPADVEVAPLVKVVRVEVPALDDEEGARDLQDPGAALVELAADEVVFEELAPIVDCETLLDEADCFVALADDVAPVVSLKPGVLDTVVEAFEDAVVLDPEAGLVPGVVDNVGPEDTGDDLVFGKPEGLDGTLPVLLNDPVVAVELLRSLSGTEALDDETEERPELEAPVVSLLEDDATGVVVDRPVGVLPIADPEDDGPCEAADETPALLPDVADRVEMRREDEEARVVADPPVVLEEDAGTLDEEVPRPTTLALS
ncbi:hypothetical protein C1H76_1710 [Elsinoe australis]|uniref:Uncharacterized protein n=1 Tax=Elsinoe australis TaxID=40998 RepID=A0A4U7BD26_9PEZI|nr:hypothetical protein C1H76_1710 [Elsinoe australis]